MGSSTRLNIELSEKQQVALKKLADEMDTTKAGVLRRALALLEIALREQKNGNRVGIVRDHQEIKEIIGIF